MNKVSDKTKGDVIEISSEKFGVRLSDEMSKMNERIVEEITKVNERIIEEISRLDNRITAEMAKVNNQISNVQANLIKWMFIFWVGKIGAILGILFAFFK